MIKCRVTALGSEKDDFGNPRTAEVCPIEASALHCVAVIPWLLRGDAGRIEVGTEVIVDRFVDGTALIVCRADGDFGGVVYGDILNLGDKVGTDFVALAQKVENALTTIQTWAMGHTHPYMNVDVEATTSPEGTGPFTGGVPQVGAESVKAK